MTRPGWENTCEHGLDLASCSKCQVAAAIAAAEERGRRRGYGQCRDDAAAVVDAAFQAGKWEGLYAKIQSLAPRDSAPVCDAVLSSDPFREWRCGKPKDHEGPHSGDRK